MERQIWKVKLIYLLMECGQSPDQSTAVASTLEPHIYPRKWKVTVRNAGYPFRFEKPQSSFNDAKLMLGWCATSSFLRIFN